MFWIILGVVLGLIKPKKTVFWQLISAEKGLIIYYSIAFVLLTRHWLASSCMGALWGVGNRAIQLCSSRINCTVASNGKV